MALPAIISDYTKQQSQAYSSLGKSLAQLGQQVGQQLAMKEYQRQASAALPAMQASYKEAFNKIGRGDYAGGYMQMMDTNLQSGALQNPFLAKYAEQAGAMAELAGKQSQSERWRMAQYGGGGIGGEGLPAATPRERAAGILLGEGQGTEVDVALPDEEIDLTQVPAEIPQQEPSISDRLNLVAQGAQSPKYKKALQDAAKNPPSEEIQNDIRTFVQDYFALDEASKVSVNDSLTKRLESRKELANLSKDKSYYKIDGAERILGKGIDGLYLKPSEEALGVTIGKTSESTRYGTNLEALQNIQEVAAGAVSELNSGKIGDFISNQGGAFNVDLIYVRDEDTGKDVPYLVNKSTPDLEKPEVNMMISGTAERVNAINQAIQTIKTIPASLQRLNARGATASMIGFQTPKSEGPTREAVRRMRTPRALSAIFE